MTITPNIQDKIKEMWELFKKENDIPDSIVFCTIDIDRTMYTNIKEVLDTIIHTLLTQRSITE